MEIHRIHRYMYMVGIITISSLFILVFHMKTAKFKNFLVSQMLEAENKTDLLTSKFNFSRHPLNHNLPQIRDLIPSMIAKNESERHQEETKPSPLFPLNSPVKAVPEVKNPPQQAISEKESEKHQEETKPGSLFPLNSPVKAVPEVKNPPLQAISDKESEKHQEETKPGSLFPLNSPVKAVPEVKNPPQQAISDKDMKVGGTKLENVAPKNIPANTLPVVRKPAVDYITKIGNSPDFQSAYGIGSLYYVHTALWTGEYVRITAIKPMGWPVNIFCFYWYSSNATIVKAIVKDLQFYKEPTSIGYIKCPVADGAKEKEIPLRIGLTNQNKVWAGRKVLLNVENRDIDPKRIFKTAFSGINEINGPGSGKKPEKNRVVEFTVCIPAMHTFGNAAQLVEKLEMVRLLGAGRVVLYEHSINANVRSVLEMYTKEWTAGTETLEVVVHSWKLPRIYVHYLAQLAAMDDCLYRYGWLSHYMIFDDLDEIMIPLRHDNWSQLIAEREKARPGSPAFMFRCSVMNKDHFTPAEGFLADALLYQSALLGFTERDTYIYESDNKGKLIVNPRKVQSMEVHHIYEANGTTDIIPEDQGLLYHYRWPLQPCAREVKDSRVVTKFGQRLLARLKLIWSKLRGVFKGSKNPPPVGNRATCKIVVNNTVTYKNPT